MLYNSPISPLHELCSTPKSHRLTLARLSTGLRDAATPHPQGRASSLSEQPPADAARADGRTSRLSVASGAGAADAGKGGKVSQKGGASPMVLRGVARAAGKLVVAGNEVQQQSPQQHGEQMASPAGG